VRTQNAVNVANVPKANRLIFFMPPVHEGLRDGWKPNGGYVWRDYGAFPTRAEGRRRVLSPTKLAPDSDGLIWLPEGAFETAFAQNASPEQRALLAAVQRPISLSCITCSATWSRSSPTDFVLPRRTFPGSVSPICRREKLFWSDLPLERTEQMTVVLITGALTGIGRATALAFAREGDQIIVSGRHRDAGEDLAKELRAKGAEVEFIALKCVMTTKCATWGPDREALRAARCYRK
jgi:short chain dehydrogenase